MRWWRLFGMLWSLFHLICAPKRRVLKQRQAAKGVGGEWKKQMLVISRIQLVRFGQSDHEITGTELTKAPTAIWTQLALAYAIHKSFIFVRVPLTAAITPKVVKTLRSWGWNIGKRKPKP